MQTLLLWVLALYGVSTLLIHIGKRLHHSRRKTGIHYCLYTCNSQNSIEWMIRYLARLAFLEGRSFRFTVYDYGSSDDTLAILEYLKRDGLFIEVFLQAPMLVDEHYSKQDTINHSGKQDKITPLGRTDDAYIVVDLRQSYQSMAS